MCMKAKTCAKVFLITFNTIFFLLGGAMLGLGIWLAVDDGAIKEVMARVPSDDDFTADDLDEVISNKSYLEKAAFVLIACGSFLFIVSFSGCCGAMKESKVLLGIYAGVLTIIVLAEIAAVAFVSIFYDKFDEYAVAYLDSTIELKYDGATIDDDKNVVINDEIFSLAWDTAMFSFECCGVTDYTDFASASAWDNTVTVDGAPVTMVVPPACCKVTNKNKFPGSVSELTFVNIEDCVQTAAASATNRNGCYSELKDWVKKYFNLICGIGITILILEITGLIATCIVMQKVPTKTQVKSLRRTI